MVVKPEECLAPSQQDQADFVKMCVKIDAELKKYFTDKGKSVKVRYQESDLTERAKKMVIKTYEEAGWRVNQGSDIWSDMRGDSGGSLFIEFTA